MSRMCAAFAASIVMTTALVRALPASAEPQPLWPTPPPPISSASDGRAYYGGSDPSVLHHDAPTIVLRAVGVPTANMFGTEGTAISAVPYRGKRVHVTGLLRSAGAGGGSFWLRVDGPRGAAEMLDNMGDRFLVGTHDWTPFSIVLGVPADAEQLVGGLILRGAGSVWADDVTVDAAEPGALVTGRLLSDPDHYFLDGTGGYRTSRKTARNDGVETVAAITLSAVDAHALDQFGSYAHVIPVDPYRGKRIRITGFASSVDAGAAGYWARVDGPEGRMLGFDNMMDRPLVGTRARTPFSIVLDVPNDAVTILGGALLAGNGSITVEDVRVAIVEPTVPTTGTH